MHAGHEFEGGVPTFSNSHMPSVLVGLHNLPRPKAVRLKVRLQPHLTWKARLCSRWPRRVMTDASPSTRG